MENFTFEKASKKTQIATTYTHAQLYLLFQDYGGRGSGGCTPKVLPTSVRKPRTICNTF